MTSCILQTALPDRVSIRQQACIRTFTGELYPTIYPLPDVAATAGSIRYYSYPLPEFECYIAYDANAEPNLYFAEEDYEAALAWYQDTRNYDFFCLFGNIHEESEAQVHLLQSIDPEMWAQLLSFARERNGLKLPSDARRISMPHPDDWIADEIHFYKKSKDGYLTTSRGYTFIQTEKGLVLLCRYDFSNASAPELLVCDIPAEISDYFCTVIRGLSHDLSDSTICPTADCT